MNPSPKPGETYPVDIPPNTTRLNWFKEFIRKPHTDPFFGKNLTTDQSHAPETRLSVITSLCSGRQSARRYFDFSKWVCVS